MRVLHDASFLDDPTRLLRAVRYETRLGFALDRRPSAWRARRRPRRRCRRSPASGCATSCSSCSPRPRRARAVERLRELGIAPALCTRELDAGRRAGCGRRAGRAPRSAPTGAWRRWPRSSSARRRRSTCGSSDLDLPAEERDAVSRAARAAPRIATRCASARARRRSCARCSGASRSRRWRWRWRCGAPAEPVLRWVTALRARAARDLRRRPAGRRRARGPGDRAGARRDAQPQARRARVGPRRGARDGAAARPGARAVRLPRRAVAFTTRQGGVSEGPYESLNLGILTDDDPERVTENRRRCLAAGVGLDPPRVAMGWQVHGTELKEWDAPPRRTRLRGAGRQELEQVDGHVTRERGSGCSCSWPTATRWRCRTADGWRCCTAAGAALAGGIVERAVARFDAAAGGGRRARDRRLLLRGGRRGAGGVLGRRRGCRRADARPAARSPRRSWAPPG